MAAGQVNFGGDVFFARHNAPNLLAWSLDSGMLVSSDFFFKSSPSTVLALVLKSNVPYTANLRSGGVKGRGSWWV